MSNRKQNHVSFANSRITGGFWKERQDTFRQVTVDAVYDRFEETGRFEALKFEWKEGMPNQPHIFWESDVTKWIEGAAYFLQQQRDPGLEARIDELVARMERTQDENGYLNAYFTVVEPDARFTRRVDHELYCAGHLTEGALAYYEATGKDNMLKVAIRYIDLIDRVFRVERSVAFDTPGHQEIELALVKLYRHTGEQRYLELAKFFIDERGRSQKDVPYEFADHAYMQSHVPVREQKEAVGHCVRALYMYSAMVDIAKETGDQELYDVCKTLFENIISKRMYVTGGIGSTFAGECFTYDYDLPEYTSYNETCASIALALFCRRMWLMEADGRFADIAEKAMYNTVMAGVSMEGDRFFYVNPMSADPRKAALNMKRHKAWKEHLPLLDRVKVFECSCCPPNLVRAVGSIADYMYSVSQDTVYAHCYMNADTVLTCGDRTVSLSQKTEYPYDGKVAISVSNAGNVTVAVRIPGWCRQATVCVNGENVNAVPEKGYVYIRRTWNDGDVITLDLPMEVKLIAGNPRIMDAAGRVAVTRGPLVYCAESVDNFNRPLRDIRVIRGGRTEVLETRISGMNVPMIAMEAEYTVPMDELYTEECPVRENCELMLIPYFAWTNRGVYEMTTWFLEK